MRATIKPRLAQALLAALLLMAGGVQAAVGHTRITRYSISYRLEADGSQVRVEDIVQQALDLEGVSALGQAFFQDQHDKPEVEILAAETLAANGEKIAVPKSAIQRQNGMLGQSVAVTDKDLVRITFPRLSPGDAIHYRVRATVKPSSDRHFAIQTSFAETLAWDSVDISLDAPADFALRFDELGLQRVADQSDGKRRKLSWHLSRPEPRIASVGELADWLSRPHLIVSSYTDWKQIAESYGKQAESRAAPTSEAKALAEGLTAGVSEPREQARRIYEWVRDNIRYTALWSGDDNWVPHDVATILKNRWGDCKDHATLLQSLLRAKGIDATQVLIRADHDSYSLPALPIGAHFNHAINFIPSLNLFLDSTAAKVPFGLLPEADLGKSVLLSHGPNPLAHTPLSAENLARVVRTSRIALHEDGSAEVQTRITGSGNMAISAREFIDRIGHQRLSEWATHEISVSGHEGSATLEIAPEADPLAYSYQLNEQIRDYLKQPEAASLRFNHAIEGPLAVTRILSRFHDAKRERPFACKPFAIEDSVEFLLPDSIRLLYLPRDFSIDEEGLSASIHYEREGDAVRAKRLIRFASDNPACPPARYAVLQPLMQRLDKAISASFLIARADALPRERCAAKPTPARTGKKRG